MAVYKSPAITIAEEDLSQYTTEANQTTAALVGEFDWGPVQSITLVQSTGEFISLFGYPTLDTTVGDKQVKGCYTDWFSAYNYLQYSSSLALVRVVEKGTYNSYLAEKTTSGSEKTYAKDNYLIKNFETYTSLLEAKSIGSNDPKIFGRYPGMYGNRIYVSILPGAQKIALDAKTEAEQDACWIYKYVANRKMGVDDVAIGIWYAPTEEDKTEYYPLNNEPNEYFLLSLLYSETDVTGYPNEIVTYMNKFSKYILINREACEDFVNIIQGQLTKGSTVSNMKFSNNSSVTTTTAKQTHIVSNAYYITGEQAMYVKNNNTLNAYDLDPNNVHLFYAEPYDTTVTPPKCHIQDKIAGDTLIKPDGTTEVKLNDYLKQYDALTDGSSEYASEISGSVYKYGDKYVHYTDMYKKDENGDPVYDETEGDPDYNYRVSGYPEAGTPIKSCKTVYDIINTVPKKPKLQIDSKSKRKKYAKIEWKNINGSLYSSNSTMKANNGNVTYQLQYYDNGMIDSMGDEDELFEELEYTYPGVYTIKEAVPATETSEAEPAVTANVTVTGKLTFVTTKLNIAVPTLSDPEPEDKFIFCTKAYDTYTFSYESEETTETDIKLLAYESGWDMFANEETTEVQGQLLIQGAGNVTIGNYMIELAATRADCIALVSPTYEEVVETRANTLFLESDTEVNVGDKIVEAMTLGSGTSYINGTLYGMKASYAFMDGNYKYQYDVYNDCYHWLPLNADIAGIFADIDNTSKPWMSPGGHYIKNCVKLAFYPTKEQRDKLFEYNINAVTNFQGEGNILWGDWTRINNTSFNFVSVRRCFLYLERNIKAYARNIMFEQNDDITRTQFVQAVDPFLTSVQAGRGIQEYKILAGSDITSAEEMDRGIFKAKIIVKPVRSIRYVVLTFSALRSDISIEEAV